MHKFKNKSKPTNQYHAECIYSTSNKSKYWPDEVYYDFLHPTIISNWPSSGIRIIRYHQKPSEQPFWYWQLNLFNQWVLDNGATITNFIYFFLFVVGPAYWYYWCWHYQTKQPLVLGTLNSQTQHLIPKPVPTFNISYFFIIFMSTSNSINSPTAFPPPLHPTQQTKISALKSQLQKTNRETKENIHGIYRKSVSGRSSKHQCSRSIERSSRSLPLELCFAVAPTTGERSIRRLLSGRESVFSCGEEKMHGREG